MHLRIGRFRKYELDILNKKRSLTSLPTDRIKKVNKILRILPKLIRKYIVKKI